MINRNLIARALVRLAKRVLSFDMTESEWERYSKEHPNAERENHRIIPDPEPTKADGTPKTKQEMHRERKALIKAHYTNLKKAHPNFVPLIKKEKLRDTIMHGSYSVISAGLNPNSPEDKAAKAAGKDKELVRKRTEELRADMDKLGVKYTEVVGCYGGEEISFLISHDLDTRADEKYLSTDRKLLVHDYGNSGDVIRKLNQLGEKYNQDSVAHSKNGVMEWHYTTGVHKGKRIVGDKTKFVTAKEDEFFTEAQISRGNYTKWSADMHRAWDTESPDYSEDNFVDNPYKA